MYCRDPGLTPPLAGSFRRDWDYHKANHVVDKLEPNLDPSCCEVHANMSAAEFYAIFHKDHVVPERVKAMLDTPKTFEDTFADIFAEAFNLLVDRQRKYGPDNIKRLGLWGTFDRLSADKIERLRRAFQGEMKGGVLKTWLNEDYDDESFEDALLDIANYALIMLALKRGVWGKPLREELLDAF
jgi:hypothetical protein